MKRSIVLLCIYSLILTSVKAQVSNEKLKEISYESGCSFK